jgi:hypothetical protein
VASLSIDWTALGTWIIGFVGALIAALSYRNSIFIPYVVAVTAKPTEELPGRQLVVVRVINRGGADGMVEDLWCVDFEHSPIPGQKMEWIGWSERPPVPFILPGRAAAVLVICFADALPANAGIQVQFGDGRARCGGLTEVPMAFSSRTAIPPDSLAVIEPPGRTTPSAP